MKLKDPNLQYRWGGTGDLHKAAEILQQHGCVEIEMPAELHHAIASHLHPEGHKAQVERVEEEGGAELLERIAEIGQLSGIAELIPLARERGARVGIHSPAPHLVIY